MIRANTQRNLSSLLVPDKEDACFLLSSARPRERPKWAKQTFVEFLLCLVRPMKNTLPLTFVAIIFSMILLSSGCQKKTPATNPNSQIKSESHESTKPLQAADLVGYDGTKLKKSVHQIKDATEKHNQEIEKMNSEPDQ